MINRKEILEFVKIQYDIEPDYPWMRTPNFAILRHKANHKWFCAVADITEDKLGFNSERIIDILLLKNDPVMIGALLNEPGILPAYHMNKEHWITVLLDGSCPKEKVFTLIDISYDLTQKK